MKQKQQKFKLGPGGKFIFYGGLISTIIFIILLVVAMVFEELGLGPFLVLPLVLVIFSIVFFNGLTFFYTLFGMSKYKYQGSNILASIFFTFFPIFPIGQSVYWTHGVVNFTNLGIHKKKLKHFLKKQFMKFI